MYNDLAEILIADKMIKVPGVGVLLVDNKPAILSSVDKQVNPPHTKVNFIEDSSVENEEADNGRLKAKNALANDLSGMQAGEIINLGHLGFFSKPENGELQFTHNTSEYPGLPTLSAIRVVRKDAVHNITVGDKVKTSAEMGVFFEEAEGVQKSKWWVWALVLAIISIVLIAIYLFETGYSNAFGLQ